MAALEAADANGGDRRCTCETAPKPPAPCESKTSLTASLIVAEPGDPAGSAHNDGDTLCASTSPAAPLGLRRTPTRSRRSGYAMKPGRKPTDERRLRPNTLCGRSQRLCRRATSKVTDCSSRKPDGKPKDRRHECGDFVTDPAFVRLRCLRPVQREMKEARPKQE